MDENLIFTERLLLRPYTEADCELMIWILRNGEISKTFMLPEFEDDATAERLFRKILIYSHQEDHFERAICLEDRLIGFLNDVEIEDGTVELGYVIPPDYQNRGYATEALKLLKRLATNMGLVYLMATVDKENIASQKMTEKCLDEIGRADSKVKYRSKL